MTDRPLAIRREDGTVGSPVTVLDRVTEIVLSHFSPKVAHRATSSTAAAREILDTFAVVDLPAVVPDADYAEDEHVPIPDGGDRWARVKRDEHGRIGVLGVSNPFGSDEEAAGTVAAILAVLRAGVRNE